MSSRVLDVLEAFEALRIADVGFHQIDEARDRGSWRLDIVGDGEEQALALVHDTLDFLIGSLQVFPVDALLSGIAPDKPDHDDDDPVKPDDPEKPGNGNGGSSNSGTNTTTVTAAGPAAATGTYATISSNGGNHVKDATPKTGVEDYGRYFLFSAILLIGAAFFAYSMKLSYEGK